MSELYDLYLERSELFYRKDQIKRKLSSLNKTNIHDEYRDSALSKKELLNKIAMLNDEITYVNFKIDQARLKRKNCKGKGCSKQPKKKKLSKSKQTQSHANENVSKYSKAIHGPVYMPSYKRGKNIIK